MEVILMFKIFRSELEYYDEPVQVSKNDTLEYVFSNGVKILFKGLEGKVTAVRKYYPLFSSKVCTVNPVIGEI